MTPFQSVWELCIIITESNLNTNPQFFHCIYGNILFTTFYQQYPKRLPYWYYIENHSRHIRLVSAKKNITKFKIRLAYVWTHSKNCKTLDPRSSSWKFLWKTFILYYARRTTIHFYSARTFFVRKSKLCNTTIMTAHYEAKNSFHVSPLYGGFWENIWIKKKTAERESYRRSNVDDMQIQLVEKVILISLNGCWIEFCDISRRLSNRIGKFVRNRLLTVEIQFMSFYVCMHAIPLKMSLGL